jgi:NAD(P)-dependent dehydrogenase (short-subunit alcohol dehydrogenase family)
MAQQGAEWGLLANCISPSACAGAEYQLPEPESDMPLGRPAYPEEIAEAARFLLASDYISGQNLEISAGWQGA